MSDRVITALTFLIAIAAGAVGAWLYPSLPAQVASHWNLAGEADGMMGKFWGVAFMPLMMLALALVFYLIPKIDPHKENYAKFRHEYNLFVLVILAFLAAVYAMTLLWNLGVKIPFTPAITTLLGALFIVLGVLMPRMKRNWFVGIRTPWTLSSDTVWEKTHRAARSIFIASGALVIASGTLYPSLFFAAIVLAVLGTLWLILYSYLEFRKEQSKPNGA